MERLNKYLAYAGIGSRRHCDDLITAGRVKINGKVVRELGLKVDGTQRISVDDEAVKAEKTVYWAVHKPPGYLCTNHDPSGRPLALDLIPHVEQRVFTVGRLDEASEGLLLMTNDGELANALMHPRFEIDKTYMVLVAGRPSPDDIQKLLDGVWIAEGKVKAKSARRMKPQGESTWLKIVLCEGKNREIRRMLAKLNHKVLQLRRLAIGPVQLDRLPRGKSRKLSAIELEGLRMVVAASQKRIERLIEGELEPTREVRPPSPRAPVPRPRPPVPSGRPAVPGATRPPLPAGVRPPAPPRPRPAGSTMEPKKAGPGGGRRPMPQQPRPEAGRRGERQQTRRP